MQCEGAQQQLTAMLAGADHNVYKTVCLSEDLLVFSFTIRAVWADDGDRPLLL
jgi:hypothetical protein